MGQQKQAFPHSENSKVSNHRKSRFSNFRRLRAPTRVPNSYFQQKKLTHLLGFVIIRLGARAMKKKVAGFNEIWTTPSGAIKRTL